MKLLEYLSKVPDTRRKLSVTYPLDKFLFFVIVATMSGRIGCRAIDRFGKQHQELLKPILGFDRMPSHVSIGSILAGVDYKELEKAFNQWAISKLETDEVSYTVVPLDSKSIKCSVTEGTSSEQNFIACVSAYAAHQGIVLHTESYENKDASEIAIVQNVIKELKVEGLVLTADALHCTKKL